MSSTDNRGMLDYSKIVLHMSIHVMFLTASIRSYLDLFPNLHFHPPLPFPLLDGVKESIARQFQRQPSFVSPHVIQRASTKCLSFCVTLAREAIDRLA